MKEKHTAIEIKYQVYKSFSWYQSLETRKHQEPSSSIFLLISHGRTQAYVTIIPSVCQFDFNQTRLQQLSHVAITNPSSGS